MRPFKEKGSIQNIHANQVNKVLAYIYISGDELVKEKSVAKNIRKVSSIKTTHGNKTDSQKHIYLGKICV